MYSTQIGAYVIIELNNSFPGAKTKSISIIAEIVGENPPMVKLSDNVPPLQSVPLAHQHVLTDETIAFQENPERFFEEAKRRGKEIMTGLTNLGVPDSKKAGRVVMFQIIDRMPGDQKMDAKSIN